MTGDNYKDFSEGMTWQQKNGSATGDTVTAPDKGPGVLPVADKLPADIEGYGNESIKEFDKINSVLDRITSESLGLPDGCKAEARIWKFKKDPWQFYSDSGQLLFSLEQLRLAVFKAIDPEGGSHCYAILRFQWTSQRPDDPQWARPEIPMVIRAVNDEGECLMQWDLGKLCVQADWIRRPSSFISDVDPGNFGRITGISWHLYYGKGRLYEC